MKGQEVESLHLCRVCGGRAGFLWVGELLDLQVRYYRCDVCGYVQTEAPHWLEQAYSQAINDSDTGILVRNNHNCRIVLATMVALGARDGSVVDCAGGYGILVRLLRDLGVAARWSDRYCPNLVAKGFEYEEGGSSDLVTAFEAFEHFEDPMAELRRMLAIAPSVLLSTELLPQPVPPQDAWWYYGREHGQHIGFFTLESLRRLASSQGKMLLSDGHSYHLITDQPRARWLWPLCMRLLRLTPMFARLFLQSKTWQDHLAMSGRNRHQP